MVLSHTVNLTHLQPGTTYHFRTRSVDSAGNVGSMHDLTFTTLPGGTPGSQEPQAHMH
jgi:predicted phage tail protein